MSEWLSLSNIDIVIKWIDQWRSSSTRSKDFSNILKHLSLREMYPLRCMREYNMPHYAEHFGPALAKWSDVQSNTGWQKAAEYACKNLMVLGLVQKRGSEVELSDLGKALIDEERNQARSVDVFRKPLPW